MKTRLQDQTIKSAKAPANGRLELKDAKVDGLMLRVTTNGVKSFALVYKVPGEGGTTKTGKPRKGKSHRMTLGTYPMLSLIDARKKADLLLEDVDMGIDPRPKRMEAVREQSMNTVAAVAKRFVERECKGLASQKRIGRTLELHVLPTFGNKPIRDIKRRAIHELLDGIVENTGAGAAAGAHKHIRSLFEWALDRGYIDRNPAHKLKRKDLKSNGSPHRALTDEELRAIWNAAGALGYPYGPCIQLLMLTGARRNEWTEASRSELDLDARTHDIPAERYKTGIPHMVPLGDAAWAIIDGLPVWNSGDFLFSTTGGAKAVNSHGDAKKRIDKLTGPLTKWSFHCFRVTAETRMADLGIRPDHFEAVMGHVKPGMQKVYNRHEYAAEKRAALGLYEAHLMEVVGQ